MSSGTLSSDRVLAFPQPACFELWERRTLELPPELSYGRTASFDRTTAFDRILSCDRTTGVLAFIRLPKYNCRTVVRHPPSAWYDAPSASCDRSTGARIYRVATMYNYGNYSINVSSICMLAVQRDEGLQRHRLLHP